MLNIDKVYMQYAITIATQYVYIVIVVMYMTLIGVHKMHSQMHPI